MPPITALLHTSNDGVRLGRTLEMLLPCAELLIVDHGSTDGTRRVAREYGARVVAAGRPEETSHYTELPRHDWILCMQPGESITEALQATLFEWRLRPSREVEGSVFCVSFREQTGEDWLRLPVPETRLIPRSWSHWQGHLPARQDSAIPLDGEMLRLAFP
jgi:glycosyltransferase involved in cell wall biosynthesis